MGFSNVFIFVLHGLLVAAFPTGDYDGVDLGLLGVPVEGIAEFSGTAPASGSCSIVGHSPCPDLLPVSSPIVAPTNVVLESNDAIICNTENDEDLVPINTEYEEAETNGKMPNKVILGALIADAIMKEKGAAVDATLAELDAFVESEIDNLGPIIQNALANTDTSVVDHCIDTALLEIESKIASELAIVDAFVDSELIRTEKLVEFVTDNADQVGSLFTTQCLNEANVTEMENASMTEKEALVAMELAMLESFVETQLAKAEAIVESELEKVNLFVESELAKVDGIVESELAKVDLFVDTELAKTDDVVKCELSKMESFVDAELEKVEMPVEGTAGFSDVPLVSTSETTDEICGYLPVLPNSETNVDDMTLSDSSVHISGTFPVSGRTLIFGSTGYLPVLPNSETNVDDMTLSDSSVHISGTFPVSGRTLIFGSTGCPPIIPTNEPLPLYVESFPVVDDDSYGDIVEEVVYDDEVVYEFEIPVVGEAVFSGVAPAEGSCKIFGVTQCYPLSLVTNSANPPMIGETYPFITKQVTGPCNNQTGNTMQNSESASDSVCYDKLWQKLYEKTSLPDGIAPQITILPAVNLRNITAGDGKIAIVGGNLAFSGTSRATGGTRLYAEFPCTPLTATEIGPDGKKYIWIARRPSKNVPPPRAAEPPRPDFPTYPADFPETVIMDSTKNYQKLISEDLDVDFGLLGPVPVAGNAFFEGTVPAFGSVSIRGHCA